MAGVAVEVASARAAGAAAEFERGSVATLISGDGDSTRVSGVEPEPWELHATTKRRTDMIRIEGVAW